MKAFAETFNECVFLENLHIYIYIYIGDVRTLGTYSLGLG